MDMQAQLRLLGFLEGGIVELIVSTYGETRVPGAAPMGATLLEGGRLLLRPYSVSTTFANLQSRRCAVLNITSDPMKFMRTALKELNPGGVLPEDWFEESKLVQAPRMKGSEAFVEVSAVQVSSEGANRAVVTCLVELVEVGGSPVRAYCRAVSALIEATIDATRVKQFASAGDSELARHHRESMERHLDLVLRVAPESVYSAAVSELRSVAERWSI